MEIDKVYWIYWQRTTFRHDSKTHKVHLKVYKKAPCEHAISHKVSPRSWKLDLKVKGIAVNKCKLIPIGLSQLYPHYKQGTRYTEDVSGSQTNLSFELQGSSTGPRTMWGCRSRQPQGRGCAPRQKWQRRRTRRGYPALEKGGPLIKYFVNILFQTLTDIRSDKYMKFQPYIGTKVNRVMLTNLEPSSKYVASSKHIEFKFRITYSK